jgi:hypothetical protein
MLTDEALDNRRWGPFPALRSVLKDKQLQDRWFGWSSASDNVFDRTTRILEIAILAEENESEILDKALAGDFDQIINDLKMLRGELGDVMSFVELRSQKVMHLLETSRAFRRSER